MKNLLRTFLFIPLFFFFTLDHVKAQIEVIIVGPTELCFGECATYELVALDSGAVFTDYEWNINGITIVNQNPITVCADSQNGINISAFGVGEWDGGLFDFGVEEFVEVTTSVNPTIISTSALCPADSLISGVSCEKVCAFNTATYEVTDVPPGTPVTWQVFGAEDYTVNGNEITVEWGAPGQGEINVVVDGSSPLAEPLQIFCGQYEFSILPNGNLGGSGFVNILGGVPPFNAFLTSSLGMSSFVLPNGGFHLFEDLPPDGYQISITDASGNTSFCAFNIVPNDQECWLSINPSEIIHASTCDDCDGSIDATINGSNLVTYQWSNGATTPSLNNLCPGIYELTVFDDFNCVAEADFIIACPQGGGCIGEASLCIEILEEPEAAIGSIPPASAGIIEVCEGQTVYFENESLGATTYAWDFGDLNTSAQFEPNHTYLAAGTYTVQLIAFNDCFCSDTTDITVEVLPAEVPEINCVGTICEGETVTYSTDVMCSTYNWSVTGSANILDGGGTGDNFVTVEWLAGPEGFISLEVAGCAGTVCNVPNVVPIPIISDAVQIQGPDKVCEGSTEEYFIPNYQGTEINWSVIGTGNIVEEMGERVVINWYGDADVGNPQLVIVEFENCYLGCSGRDTLEVNIRPSFYVEGPIKVCENSTEDYLSRNTITGAPMLSNWEVFDETSGSVWTSAGPTNTASIPWNFPAGKYIVRASAASTSSFCNDTYQIFVEVIAGPPPVASITGETEICPGEIYTYLANGLPINDFEWTVTGGSPATINGSPANVTWDASGPYALSVIQISTTNLACPSDPLDLAIGEIPPFSVTGDPEVCLEGVGAYSVPFFENIDYEWTISPAEVGTITSGSGSESVQIQWHSVGPATVSVSVCGATESFNVDVLALPEPVAQFPADLCAGETAVVTTSLPYSAYVWKNDAGAQISTLPNPMLGGGHYEVEVTDANGCVGDTIFEIKEHELPPVSISIPAYMPICPGGPNVTIYSVTTGGGGYDYEWFRNGTPIGGNTPDLVTNQEGDYQVIVTDANGCTSTSETETVLDCATVGGVCVGGVCSIPITGGGNVPGGGGGCASNGNIDFNFAATANCDELAFFNTSVDFVPGSLQWNFDDPASGAANTSTLENPTHEFSDVGYYTVLLVGNVNNVVPGGPPCLDWVFYDVLVPLKANFEAESVCPGEAMQFTDRSIFVTGGVITDWEWDFGDPASGAANTSTAQDPTHTYANSGTYTVTLTLTEASGCQVSHSETVTVFDLPMVSFPLPSITCENTSLPFDAVVPADYASLTWNFGDPTSGVANTSEVVNTFHEFDAPGAYNVNLSVTSIQGCSNDFTDVVNITPNPLTGLIAFSQPPPICEGDSVILSAPPGGTIWDWTTGSSSDEITVFSSGVYDVTLTNDEGCTYSPPDAIVDVLAEPNGIISAVQYNQYSQPTGFFESPYEVCEGEDVFLIVEGSVNNSYAWSTGEPGEEISFTEDKNNQLSVGTHTFNVTVTDGVTGCTSEEGPFEVIVNPKPDVMIQSVPSGFLCENEAATLSIVSPDPLFTYQWNTGAVTNSIDVVAGGIYFAQATNQFGCKNRSNEIELNNAPDIDLIPTGCLDRCDPDTMCLPPMGFINNFQWYLDGSPISAPNGTMEEPIFDQSGEYYVVMTDIFGCTSTSDILTLDLYPGFGDILGNVWYDVNGNGVIDGPDTLLSGIDIILNDGSANVDTVTSNSGQYIFVSVGANGYTLELDTTSLPTDWSAYWIDGNVDIIGCDVEESFDWLVIGCIPSIENIPFSACEGDGIIFDGTFVPAGTTQNFSYPAANGCDSIVIVEVEALPPDSEPLEFSICENETITYDGVVLSPGDSQDFIYQNINGCDSTVMVSVVGLETNAEMLTLTTCSGVPVIYDGVPLDVGDTQDFVFQNMNGCDSTVTVMVTEAPPVLNEELIEICENTTVEYAGVTLSPGDVEVFTLIDQFGCDSLVEVTVDALSTQEESWIFTACPGESITFGGVQYVAGDSVVLNLQTFQGCDSTVTIKVNLSPTHNVDVTLEVCEGETIDFHNQALSAGDVSTVTLTNQFGCDSIVTANVMPLPAASFDLTANEICWNASDGEVEVSNLSGGLTPYQVSIDGVNFQPDLLFENLDPGPYTIFLQDGNDCVFENETEVLATPPLTVEAEDQTMECGDLVTLNPFIVSELPHTLTWPDGSSDPTFDVTIPGIYSLQVENDCEIVTREIAVELEPGSLSTRIYMPNSFSPNADGKNDCYQGYLAPGTDVEYFLLRIFDRWGNQMFESNDPDECWDGHFRGKPMDPAVFAWFVEMRVRNCDGQLLEYFEEGGIHLMK